MAITSQQIITASLNVTFTISGSSLLKAEIDARHNGGNAGKTNFKPGDNAAWLLFRGPEVYVDAIITSAGNTSGTVIGSKGGDGEVIAINEIITVSGAYDASVGYPCYSGFWYEWLGTPGAIKVDPPVAGSTQVNFSGTGPYGAIGSLHVKYNTLGEMNKLVNTFLPFLKYEIVVFIAGRDPNL